MLVDQNMACGSNTDQRDHFPRIQLVVSLFSGINQICIPTFPFEGYIIILCLCICAIMHVSHAHFYSVCIYTRDETG